MTNTAKSITLICIAAFIIGLVGRNVALTTLALSFLSWLAAAYLIFRARCLRLKTRLNVTRTIQNSDSSNNYLWANRIYPVQVEIESLAGIPSGTYFRDVLPDLIVASEVIPHSPKKPIEGSILSKREDIARESNEMGDLSTRIANLNKRVIRLAKLSKWLLPSTNADIQGVGPAPSFWSNRKAQTSSLNDSLNNLRQANSLTTEASSKKVVLNYQIQPLAAGQCVLPGVRICLFDFFQWYRWDTLVPCQQKIMALPNYHKGAEVRSTLKNVNAIPQHGIHRQRRPGMGFELLELREYQDGDPPKSIAWKASARRENLMTRQYESEVPIRVQLVVEGRAASRVGAFGLRALDQINQIATSIAHIATSNGDHVGGYLIDDNKTETLPALGGTKGFHQIARSLSRFSSGRYPRHVRWTEELQDAAFAVASEYYPHLLNTRVNPLAITIWDTLSSKIRHRHVQLANLIATRKNYNVLQHAELLTNPHLLATQLQRFLCDHGSTWQVPLLSQREITRAIRPTDWHPIVSAIQSTVAKAKDNEVIVVFCDLVSAERRHEPLLDACRMARGRKHRIVVISTSPNIDSSSVSTRSRSQGAFTSHLKENADELRELAETLRFQEEASKMIKKFREQAIPCAVAANLESIPNVLSEVELARSGRFTRSGALS